MPPLVYRPTFVRALSVLTWVLLAVALVGSAADDPVGALRWLPVLALAAALVYVLFWRPCVEVDVDAVTVRNLVRDVRIPWRCLDAVDTRYSLRLESGDRRYTAWAAPAPGRSNALRQSRYDTLALQSLGTNVQDGLRSSAAPNSDSGGAALMVRARWERALATSPERVEDGERVSVSVAALPAVCVCVPLAATALVLLLG